MSIAALELQLATLRKHADRTQRLLAYVASWFETLPARKTGQNGSVYWRAGGHLRNGRTYLDRCIAALAAATHEDGDRAELVRIADECLFEATLHAGGAVATRAEATVRQKCGNKSAAQRKQSEQTERCVAAAAALPGSSPEVAAGLSKTVARAELTLRRKVLHARA